MFMNIKKREIKMNQYVKKSKQGTYYVDIDSLAFDLMNDNTFITIFNKHGEELLVYNYEIGIYESNGKEVLKREIENLLEEWSKISVVNEVIEKIKRKTSTSLEKFNNVPDTIIPLKNGVLNIITGEFGKHNPKNHFTSIIPIKYDDTLDCPLIKKFLEETLYPDDIPVIQEWFGYHLYKKYCFKKGVIIFGEKNTGKTQLLKILIKFIGDKNITGIPLQDISRNNKFYLASLHNKYANIYDDLSFKDLNDAGGFKVATGGGWITAEYKFGDTFQFQNYAKQTFATNKIPIVESDDEAYYLRWLPIACDKEVSEEEQDKFLIERICTDEEMSGLLNWALSGLKRLLETSKFSFNKSTQEIKEIMEKHSNPLISFIVDNFQEVPGFKINKDEMYELYQIYCQVKKFPLISKNMFGRNLKKHCKYILDGREDERYWLNVQIKPDTYDTIYVTYRVVNDIYKGYLDMLFLNMSYLSDKIKDKLKIDMEKI